MKKVKKFLMVGLIGLLMAGGLILAGCDEIGPCSTGGNCRVDGISVSGNWCKESRCIVSKSGTNHTDYCDCN